MPSLKKIMDPAVPVDIPFGAELVRAYYRPQYLTPELESQFRKLNKAANAEKEGLSQQEKDALEEQTSEAYRGILVEIVESWDLKYDDEDPAPIPLTKEGISRVPYDILNEILGTIMDQELPNRKTDQDSDAGSLQTAGSDTNPGGTP